MTDFSPRSVTKFGHGRHGWIESAGGYPVRSFLDLPRGMVTVQDDGWTYVYQVSRKDRRAFKNWARETFSGMNCDRVRGVWPHYRVVSV